MTSPILALRAAIVARCASDAVLAAILGDGTGIRDGAPAGFAPVYAIFGATDAADWSTSSDRGHEHALAVEVWGSPEASTPAIAAANRIAELLDDPPLRLEGHRLVQLAVTAVRAERDRDTNLPKVTVRTRATTEATS